LIASRCVLALRCAGQCIGLPNKSLVTLAHTVIERAERLSPGTHTSTGTQDACSPGPVADLEQSVIGVLKLADHEPGGKSTSAGTAVFPTSDDGRSLLHLAASLGFRTLVEELLRRGFDIEKRDENGFTAFDYSAFYGHTMCSELLVQAGAENGTVNTRMAERRRGASATSVMSSPVHAQEGGSWSKNRPPIQHPPRLRTQNGCLTCRYVQLLLRCQLKPHSQALLSGFGQKGARTGRREKNILQVLAYHASACRSNVWATAVNTQTGIR